VRLYVCCLQVCVLFGAGVEDFSCRRRSDAGVFRIVEVEVGDWAGKDRLQEDWNCIAAD
jgi:hypothetical protein